MLDRDAGSFKKAEAPNAGAAVRIEDLEFPCDGKAYLKASGRYYVAAQLEGSYSLEIAQIGGEPVPAAAKPVAAATTNAAAASTAESAPVAATTSLPAGLSTMWVGIGVVGMVVLVAGAYSSVDDAELRIG